MTSCSCRQAQGPAPKKFRLHVRLVSGGIVCVILFRFCRRRELHSHLLSSFSRTKEALERVLLSIVTMSTLLISDSEERFRIFC